MNIRVQALHVGIGREEAVSSRPKALSKGALEHDMVGSFIWRAADWADIFVIGDDALLEQLTSSLDPSPRQQPGEEFNL